MILIKQKKRSFFVQKKKCCNTHQVCCLSLYVKCDSFKCQIDHNNSEWKECTNPKNETSVAVLFTFFFNKVTYSKHATIAFGCNIQVILDLDDQIVFWYQRKRRSMYKVNKDTDNACYVVSLFYFERIQVKLKERFSSIEIWHFFYIQVE